MPVFNSTQRFHFEIMKSNTKPLPHVHVYEDTYVAANICVLILLYMPHQKSFLALIFRERERERKGGRERERERKREREMTSFQHS